MKTIRKVNILIACIAMLLITACINEEVVRVPSPVANPNSTNVYFTVDNDSSLILSKVTTSFSITVGREKTDKDQVVTLSSIGVNDSVLSIPKTVSFAVGESKKVVQITVKNMELMKKYHLTFSIDPEQTNPYSIQNVYPRLELSVLKEDFAPYANGTYTSLYFKSNWPQTMEYSPSTKVFRLKDCWVKGYNVTFKWDDTTQASAVTMIGSAATGYIIILTGYLHPTYGMVSAYYSTANTNYYNKDTKTFTFPITWRVAAGSFGLKNDTYVITQKL